MATIKINNLIYKDIINNLTMDIEPSSWISVIGKGKTTLFNLLNGDINSNGSIIINNISVDKYNVRDLHETIYFLSSNADDNFVSGTVLGNILYAMDKYSNYIQDKRLQTLVNYFELENILYKNPNNLSAGQKELVAFVSTIILNPQILVIDDSFRMMDGLSKKRVYSLIKKYVEQGMIVINMVSNPDDLLYGERTIILDKKISIVNKDELLDEHTLRSIGFNLPFVLDLSNKLKYYKMIDKSYLDTSKLVNSIWK